MDNLLVILSFASLVALVVGIIKPRLVGMPSNTWVLLVFGGIAVVSFTILGTTASPTPAPSTQAVSATPIDKVTTPQGQIEQLAANAAPGMTNMSNENHLRNVTAVRDPQGGWDVDVQLNADDNLTEHYAEVGVDQQISDEFIALYTGTTTVSSASVEVFMQLTDKYGNTKDDMVYGATLDKATASQVNWSADQSVLEIRILPGVWNTDYDLFSVDPNL